MLNKTELINKIENLPIYEFKEVFTKEKDNFNKQDNFKAIVEIGQPEALSVVTNRYKLIQFKEILLPVINSLGDLEGETKVYGGEGYTLIFPDQAELNCSNGKLGLIIFNSVTKKYAVLIDFVVRSGNSYIILPKKIKAFKNKHTGNIKEVVKDYEKILTNVREQWEIISNQFNRTIGQEEYNFILDELRLSKKIKKEINSFAYGLKDEGIILWDLLIEVIKNIQEKQYRNEVNKMKKIKFITEIIYKYAFIEGLK